MPLYDITAANRQAVQSGLALGQAMFQNDLRMQQFKSEEALRRIQEQQAAETLRYAQWQHSQMIDQQAENAKRTAAFQSMITPTLQMPANDMTEFSPMIGPSGQPMAKPNVVNGMTEVPNPAHVPDMGAAYIQAFLPNNPNPAQVIATGGALTLHQAQAEKAKADATRMAATGGAGDITQVTGSFPGSPTLNVYRHPNGTTEIVGDIGKGPDIVTQGDRQFYKDLKGGLHPLPQDQMKRMSIMALHGMVKDNLDLAVQNPEAPQGMLMPDPTKLGILVQRQSTTPAVKTKLETQLAQAEKTLTALDDMEKTLRPEDVGVKGIVGSELGDIWLPQLGFDTADVKRMDNRTRLKSLAEGMLREVSDDTRFSNADREDIKSILPKAGARESYPNAIQTIRTLKGVFAKRAIINAKGLGRPTPLWAISNLSPDRFLETAQAGQVDRAGMLDAIRLRKIDAPKAIEIWNQLHPEEAAAPTQPTP